MKSKPKVKTPAMVPDTALEAQMKALAEQPPTRALVKANTEEVRLEKIRKSNAQGEREIARAASGRFVRHSTASAQRSAKKVQQFLAETDPDTGKSRQDSLLDAAYEGALKAAKEPKALGNAVKAVEMLDEISGHAKVREQQLADQSHIQQPFKTVYIGVPVLLNPEIIKEEDLLRDTKTKPSFAESEVVQQNSATGLDRC